MTNEETKELAEPLDIQDTNCCGKWPWIFLTAILMTVLVLEHLDNRMCVNRGGQIDRKFIFYDGCIGVK